MKTGKLLTRLSFGCGFIISFLLVFFLFLTFSSFTITSDSSNQTSVEKKKLASDASIRSFKQTFQFYITHDIEERIQQSDIIAITEYEKSPDGRMKAVIRRFLKGESDINFPYDLGDEYLLYSYYPPSNNAGKKGIILMLYKNRAMGSMAYPYSNTIETLDDLIAQKN